MGLKKQVIGLNESLTAVYKVETRWSTILAKFGFDSRQIENLRFNHIDKIVNDFILLVRCRVSLAKDGERLFYIINRRFGLDGNPIETFQNIGTQLGISGKRVRQLHNKAVRRSRHKAYISWWETNLSDLASQLLEVNMNKGIDKN